MWSAARQMLILAGDTDGTAASRTRSTADVTVAAVFLQVGRRDLAERAVFK
jgi:hypothetical protein